MSKELQIQEWVEIFRMNAIDIADTKDWRPYCFNEGLADKYSLAELTIEEAMKLSSQPDEIFQLLWQNYK